MDAFSPSPFAEAARRAFPVGLSALAGVAATELTPLVDDSYRQRSDGVDVSGQIVGIPRRLHFAGLSTADAGMAEFSLAARCLITRATDGVLRQQALRSIIHEQRPWTAPFVLLLLGEYVVEIVEDIAGAVPGLDREIYRNLVLENRSLVRKLRAQATSYWDVYYRQQYPVQRDYPALKVLHELERWAG